MLPLPVRRALRKLGHDLRDARRRRRIPLTIAAQRASISRMTLIKIEKGDAGVALGLYATVLFVMFCFNWRYIIFYFLPFFYLGHCFSYLNGYFRHYGANPDKPVAWGVSSYGKIYNWIFFYNGYHAEHHFRPKVHWTQMENFHQQIAGLQEQEGVRVIKRAHMLGFLDPNLPPRKGSGGEPATVAS